MKLSHASYLIAALLAATDHVAAQSSSHIRRTSKAGKAAHGGPSAKSSKAMMGGKHGLCLVEGQCAPPTLGERNFDNDPFPPQGSLKTCLQAAITGFDAEVTIADYNGDAGGYNSNAANKEQRTAPKLSFIDEGLNEGDPYARAKYSSHGYTRNPAGILFAESRDEVVAAVNCARSTGYQVAPRGRG